MVCHKDRQSIHCGHPLNATLHPNREEVINMAFLKHDPDKADNAETLSKVDAVGNVGFAFVPPMEPVIPDMGGYHLRRRLTIVPLVRFREDF